MEFHSQRCSACPRLRRQIPPDGPLSARVAIIGDLPMRAEEKSFTPCSGIAGEELDETYLRAAGLERADVFVTLALQCRQEKNGQDIRPGASLIRTCAENHLPEELRTVWPDVVVLMGAAACSVAGITDLELTHGRPRYVSEVPGLGMWSGWIVPMYAPGAGIRDTRFMIPLLDDWTQLGLWLKGKKDVYPVAPTRTPEYELLRTRDDVRGYFARYLDDWPAIDTESDEGRPWSVQFSFTPGTAAMILVENSGALGEFATGFNRHVGRCIMHHAIHDLDELDQLGIVVKEHRDTMQELYHLGNLPQGLKAAVYRTLGHRMISYNETVVPHSRAALDVWLAEALGWVSGERVVEPHPPGPGCPTCGKKHRKDVSSSKPHIAEAVLRRVMGRIADPTSEYDPWAPPKMDHGVEKPRLFGRPWMPAAESAVGRMPRQSIIHVPLDAAVAYGCSDADWTGQLALWLTGERERITKEEWRVAA
jgi:uracil-DNA glycosylase family 4